MINLFLNTNQHYKLCDRWRNQDYATGGEGDLSINETMGF